MRKNIVRLHLKSQLYLVIAFVIFLLHLFLNSFKPLGKEYSIFYLDEEYTIGVLFTSALTLITGLEFISYAVKKFIKKNLIIFLSGFFFLALSIDEFFSIHETFNTYIRESVLNIEIVKSSAEVSWVFSLLLLALIVIALLIMLVYKEKDFEIKTHID